jgi:hypothetical protein
VPVQKSEGENVPFWTLHLDEYPVFEVDIIVVMRERSQHNTRLWCLLGELDPTMAFDFPGPMAVSPIIMIPHG